MPFSDAGMLLLYNIGTARMSSRAKFSRSNLMLGGMKVLTSLHGVL